MEPNVVLAFRGENQQWNMPLMAYLIKLPTHIGFEVSLHQFISIHGQIIEVYMPTAYVK